MKHCWMIIVALFVSLDAVAQSNRIYVEPFEICPDSTLAVPVILANETPTRGLQFNMTLPEGLAMDECEITRYCEKYSMSLFTKKNGDVWTIGMYPMGSICLPADTKAILMLQMMASPTFMGGEIVVWKCRGSTIDNKTIYMDGDTTAVTVSPL